MRNVISAANEESDFARRKRLQDKVVRSIRCFRAADRLGREALHERKRPHAER